MGRGHRGCTPSCTEFISYWKQFWDRHAAPTAPPVAVIKCDSYLTSLSGNARKLARRAYRRYTIQQIDFNEHHKAIQAVNQSKTSTTQGPTYGWFVKRVLPHEQPVLCDIHKDLWYGGFDTDGVLRGYWSIAKINSLGTSVWLFRHADNSEYVLNGLIAYICENAGVDYVTYHTMNAEPHTGRPEFKRRIGCREARLTFQA